MPTSTYITFSFSYLSLKEPSEAAKTLYRVADSSSMYVSTYICKRFNLIEEAESYGYLCMEKCLAEAAWQNFYKVVDLIDSLKVSKIILVIVSFSLILD